MAGKLRCSSYSYKARSQNSSRRSWAAISPGSKIKEFSQIKPNFWAEGKGITPIFSANSCSDSVKLIKLGERGGLGLALGLRLKLRQKGV